MPVLTTALASLELVKPSCRVVAVRAATDRAQREAANVFTSRDVDARQPIEHTRRFGRDMRVSGAACWAPQT